MNTWLRMTHKNRIGRKVFAAFRQVSRAVKRWPCDPGAFAARPPILANSFPKSGTHLLTQILDAFPDRRSYGSLITSVPSITYRERSPRGHARLLRLIVPGEVVTAHLFHEPLYQALLTQKRCVHFFIFRDLRDVVVSEAHYLTFMNPWHRLHRHFRAREPAERIALAISGFRDPSAPCRYPDVAARFARYAGWLEQSDVFPVRYEELATADRREQVVADMVRFYSDGAGLPCDLDTVVASAIRNIRPHHSHTFRRGKVGGWRGELTPRLKDLFKRVAGDLLVDLGYERDLDW